MLRRSPNSRGTASFDLSDADIPCSSPTTSSSNGRSYSTWSGQMTHGQRSFAKLGSRRRLDGSSSYSPRRSLPTARTGPTTWPPWREIRDFAPSGYARGWPGRSLWRRSRSTPPPSTERCSTPPTRGSARWSFGTKLRRRSRIRPFSSAQTRLTSTSPSACCTRTCSGILRTSQPGLVSATGFWSTLQTSQQG
ncbi:hypothetical protein D9M72_383990 [compost metagenome]